jgi:hypothetical protein
LRVAEDGIGIVAMYTMLVRRSATGLEVELTGMPAASRAQEWAVDRLLVLDMREQHRLGPCPRRAAL